MHADSVGLLVQNFIIFVNSDFMHLIAMAFTHVKELNEDVIGFSEITSDIF